MKLKNKEADNMTADTDEVQELARKLDDWAQKELPETQQSLLRGLLTRCEYRENEERIDIGEGTYVFETNIKQAVMDALAPLNSGKPPKKLTEDWPRGAPSWSRSTWPRG